MLDTKFIALGHNTIRGAAGAAVLNAELMLADGWVDCMAATSSVGTIVMKFGGTSVADAEAIAPSAVDRDGDERETLDVPPVVVVSATSGATDQLLALAADAQRGSDGVDAGVDRVLKRHLDLVNALTDGRARRPRSQPSSRAISTTSAPC